MQVLPVARRSARGVSAIALAATATVALSAGPAIASPPAVSAPPAAESRVSAANSQWGTLVPQQEQTFKTWFWGRTEVCWINLGGQNATYHWVSSTTYANNQTLPPHGQHCEIRSFAGFNLWTRNDSPAGTDASIKVTLPIGP